MKYATINYNEINSSLRFDGSYHLSDGVLYSNKIQKMKFDFLGNLASEIFTAGRTKRIYTSKERGYPYLSNSDVSKNNPFESCNFNSKKHGCEEKSILKEGMIVTGRVGAIGQTSYINSEYEELKAMGSDNIIRIVVKDKSISGYIYAYLVSKYGNIFFHKLASGGVQPYISEEMIKAIPVPLFQENKQQLIHQLIVDSATLRVESNKLMNEVIAYFNEKYNVEFSSKINIINIKKLLSGDQYTKESRFEADFYDSSTENLRNNILLQGGLYLGDISNEIQRSGLRERKFVMNNGVPLITGQDLSQAYLKNLKLLSKKFTRNIDKNLTKNNDILISVQGTIGRCEFVLNNQYLDVFASEQLSKIKINDKLIHPGFVFAFLKSIPGQVQLKKFKTGSVIEWVKENNIASVIIPSPTDKGKTIGDIVEKSVLIQNLAVEKEKQAIDLIEKEIDAWQ